MSVNSKDVFDYIRPKLGLKQTQVDALYKILEQVDINLVVDFLGMQEDINSKEGLKEDAVLSKYKLSERSEKSLVGVNEDLVKVVRRAIEITEQDFVVIEGLRTKEQAYINYGKGRTTSELKVKGVPIGYAKPKEAKVTWLSNPLGSRHMKGGAVDITPFPVDWTDLSKFKKIAEAMKKASKELNIEIVWGGDWKKVDYPHFELK